MGRLKLIHISKKGLQYLILNGDPSSEVAHNSSLHWRHNDLDDVSNHQPHGCTQPFIQTQIKENIKAPRHWPLCGEFTGTGEFPSQRASYTENVSIWWRHHVKATEHNSSCSLLKPLNCNNCGRFWSTSGPYCFGTVQNRATFEDSPRNFKFSAW